MKTIPIQHTVTPETAIPLTLSRRVDLAFSPDLGLMLDDDGTILACLSLSRAGRHYLLMNRSPVGRNYNLAANSGTFDGLTLELDNLWPI